MLKIDIITLFPKMFKGPFDESILRRASNKGLVEIKIHNLRKWTNDKRGTVDDKPYGGGTGMVMMVAPIAKAIEELRITDYELRIILLSPRGKVWKQNLARKYSKLNHLILICGHYEGVDERVREFIDEEISIGDFILTGGEIPAMVLVDSIVRLVPGVLVKENATIFESFSLNTNRQPLTTLEYPQYTHPEEYKGLNVPKILLSGNHKEIDKWRKQESIKITKKVRPELIKISEELKAKSEKP